MVGGKPELSTTIQKAAVSSTPSWIGSGPMVQRVHHCPFKLEQRWGLLDASSKGKPWKLHGLCLERARFCVETLQQNEGHAVFYLEGGKPI